MNEMNELNELKSEIKGIRMWVNNKSEIEKSKWVFE